MAYFDGIKKGDRIWNINSGWATVIRIYDFGKKSYLIIVEFDTDKRRFSLTEEGKSYPSLIAQDWFWDEIEITPRQKPLPKLEKDAKILVWNNGDEVKTQGYFSHFDSSGRMHCYIDGRASWTSRRYETIPWNHWELPTDIETKDAK